MEKFCDHCGARVDCAICPVSTPEDGTFGHEESVVMAKVRGITERDLVLLLDDHAFQAMMHKRVLYRDPYTPDDLRKMQKAVGRFLFNVEIE